MSGIQGHESGPEDLAAYAQEVADALPPLTPAQEAFVVRWYAAARDEARAKHEGDALNRGWSRDQPRTRPATRG